MTSDAQNLGGNSLYNAPSLTAEQLKARLYSVLQANGTTHELRTQLRSRVLESMRAHGGTSRREVSTSLQSRASRTASILHRAVDTLVLEHLWHLGYSDTQHLFSTESGIGESRLTIADVMQVLRLVPRPDDGDRAGPSLPPPDICMDTPLLHVLTTLSNLVAVAHDKSFAVASKGIQCDASHGPTIDDKFRYIEASYRPQHEHNKGFVEDTMRRYRSEVDARMQEQLALERTHWLQTEGERCKREEAAKYAKLLSQKLTESQAKEAHAHRELKARELRVQQKERELEARAEVLELERLKTEQHMRQHLGAAIDLQKDLAASQDKCRRLQAELNQQTSVADQLHDHLAVLQARDKRRSGDLQALLEQEWGPPPLRGHGPGHTCIGPHQHQPPSSAKGPQSPQSSGTHPVHAPPLQPPPWGILPAHMADGVSGSPPQDSHPHPFPSQQPVQQSTAVCDDGPVPRGPQLLAPPCEHPPVPARSGPLVDMRARPQTSLSTLPEPACPLTNTDPAVQTTPVVRSGALAGPQAEGEGKDRDTDRSAGEIEGLGSLCVVSSGAGRGMTGCAEPESPGPSPSCGTNPDSACVPDPTLSPRHEVHAAPHTMPTLSYGPDANPTGMGCQAASQPVPSPKAGVSLDVPPDRCPSPCLQSGGDAGPPQGRAGAGGRTGGLAC